MLPRWARRFLIWPLPLLLVWLYVATVPLLVIVALVLSYRLPGKLRALRALGLATVYVFVEVAIIVVAFTLWVVSGFGWGLGRPSFQRAHYRLLGWALRTLVGAGRRLFVLDIDVRGVAVRPGADPMPLPTEAAVHRPAIVMSRHAGPADSILLMHEVVDRFDRDPRIVLKETLQWDPAFDILLNRIPTHFVRHGDDRDQVLRDLASLAADMGPRDAFVIFPEGGNFTPSRRERAIEYFERNGRHDEAERARRLVHVLPPRTNGALAALDGCPEALAVFVAHTGLDDITGVRDLWRAIPDHKVLDMVFGVIPADDLPASTDDRVELLWRAWERIDEWIAAHADDAAEPA
jgi:1-acyl-sn-glycerol-3-phosphate acyltransferase